MKNDFCFIQSYCANIDEQLRKRDSDNDLLESRLKELDVRI